MGLSGALVGPIIPVLAAKTGSTEGAIAWLLAAKGFGALLGAYATGRTLDKTSSHKLIGILLLLLSLSIIPIPLSESLQLLVLLLLVGGLAEGGIHVGINSLLVRLHKENVGPYMNGLHLAFGSGATVAPIAVSISLGLSGSIDASVFLCSSLLLPTSLLFFSSNAPIQIVPETANSSLPLSGKFQLVLIGFFFFLYVGAEGAWSGWIASYGISLRLSNESGAALLNSSFWAGLTIGRFLGIRLVRNYSTARLISMQLMAAIAIVITHLLTSASLSSTMIVSGLFGLSIASIFPMTLSYSSGHLHLDSRITGFFLVAAASGGMSIPWIVGQMFSANGAVILPIAELLILTIALFTIQVVIRRFRILAR